MDITLSLINEIASPEVVARGRAYFHEGRVHLETAGDNFVRATVNGSDLYTVELHSDSSGFEATCTCPFQWEGKCKHIVATMLATLYRNAKLEYNPQQTQQEPTEYRQTSWVQDIRKLLAPSETETKQEKSEPAWRLVYGLNITDKRRSLYPVKLKLTKDGLDGQGTRLKKFDLFSESHFDFVDRVLVERTANDFFNFIPQDAHDALPEDSDENHSWGTNDILMGDMLSLLVNKELYLAHQTNYTFRRLYVSDEPAHVKVGISEAEDGSISLQSELEWRGELFPLPVDLVILSIDILWVLFDNNVVRIVDASASDLAVLMKMTKTVIVPSYDRSEFMEEVLPRLVKRYRVRSELSSIQAIDATPKPRIYLSELNDKLNVEMRFLYETVEVREATSPIGTSAIDQHSPAHDLISDGEGFVYVHRKPDAEAAFSKALTDSSLSVFLRNDGTRNYFPSINPLEWLLKQLPALRTQGFEIFGQENLKKHRLRIERPKVGLRVSSGIDWFDLSVDVKFNGSAITFQAFVDAVEKNERFVKLDDGTIGVLPELWLKRFRRALALGNPGKESFKLSRTHLGLLNEFSTEADEFESDEQFEEMLQRLQSFTTINKQKLPKHFQGELRPYQKAGYDWLNFLREFGVGGILADDMGLGKTVQALVLLQKVYEDEARLPSLIVVPTSPLFNWQKEIERFTPNLRTLIYTGLDRKQHQDSFNTYQIVVTSYGILRRDIDALKKQEFLYVVLDESQNIKNPISINAQAVRALNARHRLALSGTPVENNLNELWSQFAFLNPGMLGSERMFTENFAKPIEKFGDESTSTSLKQLIFPFILRRTKELVATELPPKVESTVYCDMDADQKRAYEYWRQYYREAILKSIETVGFQKSKIKVLEGLMRLRQVCCHPLLVDGNYKGTAGKFDAFIEMLDDILAEGHKLLVFSQFVKMLSVLRQHCDKQKIVYEYLDGSTTNRRERVERFQSDEHVKLFLISLKAGGTGLNLTAADYVIHYDPWWNPAVEMQATDRTHRIGQTKQVFAYKLITRESVEEKILALQEKKRALVKSIITTDSGFMKSLTKENVEALFS